MTTTSLEQTTERLQARGERMARAAALSLP